QIDQPSMTTISCETSMEALTQLLMQPQSLLLSPPQSNSLQTDIPLHLTNPLFPQIVQQQILNYSLMQKLFSTLAAQTSMELSSPTLSSNSQETPEVGTSNGKELTIPNDDNEGWCRNRKHIMKTDNGFMCLVCKKVYGRYNSVSYHVTIYHRNPPIKCDIESCDFTTREARYIHFHKYYRHGIPLPRSIDQGSRKCPSCKHVSKSPAMLEKHMKRHSDGQPLTTRKRRSESTCEPMMENYESRSRTLSECPIPTLEMIMEECIKPRSFTL
ncbi:pqm-1, partial [Pristionchus pacificus]|uniref:C2H2-type domain-containing protein n=1 Tax=Pristionchus pacificus TaxID=54126 RepID=A0A8R1V2I8_PRIPA